MTIRTNLSSCNPVLSFFLGLLKKDRRQREMDLSYCRLILLLPSRLFLLSFKRLVSTAFPLMVRIVMKLWRMMVWEWTVILQRWLVAVISEKHVN